MSVATITFFFDKPSFEGAEEEINKLDQTIRQVLDQHFPNYETADKAREEFLAFEQSFVWAFPSETYEGRMTRLQALDLAMEGNPLASSWRDFLSEARDQAGQQFYNSGLGGPDDLLRFEVKINTHSTSYTPWTQHYAQSMPESKEALGPLDADVGKEITPSPRSASISFNLKPLDQNYFKGRAAAATAGRDTTFEDFQQRVSEYFDAHALDKAFAQKEGPKDKYFYRDLQKSGEAVEAAWDEVRFAAAGITKEEAYDNGYGDVWEKAQDPQARKSDLPTAPSTVVKDLWGVPK